MDGPVAVMDSRLIPVLDRMKTETGRRLAEIRTKRLVMFREWWDEENGVVKAGGGA